MTIAFGSFEGVIEGVKGWGDPPVIQLEKVSNPLKFKEPFVVVDPVDPNRNVSSAVTETALWTFVAAARAFSSKPSKKFFTPEFKRASNEPLKKLAERGVDVLFVIIPDADPPVPDTLWGQLYRTEKALGRVLSEWGLRTFRSGTWSDETERHIFTYEIDSIVLPPVVKKVGPPVRLIKDSEDFLSNYIGSPDLVSGPGIEGGKWWVEVDRKHKFTRAYIRSVLFTGCEELGVPKRVADLLRGGGKVLINEEIESEYSGEFPAFLEDFLKGRPDWLG
jgi:tRNA nucleotidyltransferase (CCA-adding enzyme)